MTKQEQRINEMAAAIEQHKELTCMINEPMTDRNGNSRGCHYAAIVDSERLAAALIEEGFGNVRSYRAKFIKLTELYLKGQTAELLKFIMEEV